MAKIILALAFAVLAHSQLFAQTDFYKGKTIRVIIGYSAGGTNDLWARAVAKRRIR
jgi:tripartite-type tricarboxylate transporter receptor subunit TctC